MKKFVHLIAGALFIFLTAITVTQIGGFTANAQSPITSPITAPITSPATPTPTPTTTPPITSAITPTPTDSPTPTPTQAQSQPTNNDGNNKSNDNGGSKSSQACTDGKPGSAPKLISAVTTGKNQVTLTWTKVADPISYYMLVYGTKSGVITYATTPIQGKNTTSFSVNALAIGKTYYFRVRGGNGCMPGDYSNELSIKVTGTIGAKNVFAPSVLSKTTQNLTGVKIVPTSVVLQPVAQKQPASTGNSINTAVTFFLHLFGH